MLLVEFIVCSERKKEYKRRGPNIFIFSDSLDHVYIWTFCVLVLFFFLLVPGVLFMGHKQCIKVYEQYFLV